MDPLKVFNPDILEMIKTSNVNSVSQTFLGSESIQLNEDTQSSLPISQSLLEEEARDVEVILPLESLYRSQYLMAFETQDLTMDSCYVINAETQPVSQSILDPATQVVTLNTVRSYGSRPAFLVSDINPQKTDSQSLLSSNSQDLVSSRDFMTSGSSRKDQSYPNWNSRASTPDLPTQPLPQNEAMAYTRKNPRNPSSMDGSNFSFKEPSNMFQDSKSFSNTGSRLMTDFYPNKKQESDLSHKQYEDFSQTRQHQKPWKDDSVANQIVLFKEFGDQLKKKRLLYLTSFEEVAEVLVQNGYGCSDLKPEVTSQIDAIFSRLNSRYPYDEVKNQIVENVQKVESKRKEVISELLSTLKEFRQNYSDKVQKRKRQAHDAGHVELSKLQEMVKKSLNASLDNHTQLLNKMSEELAILKNELESKIEILSHENRKRKLETENFVTRLNQNLDQLIVRVRAKHELEVGSDPTHNIKENLVELFSPELNRKRLGVATSTPIRPVNTSNKKGNKAHRFNQSNQSFDIVEQEEGQLISRTEISKKVSAQVTSEQKSEETSRRVSTRVVPRSNFEEFSRQSDVIPRSNSGVKPKQDGTKVSSRLKFEERPRQGGVTLRSNFEEISRHSYSQGTSMEGSSRQVDAHVTLRSDLQDCNGNFSSNMLLELSDDEEEDSDIFG